jgi:hypothetical protein
MLRQSGGLSRNVGVMLFETSRQQNHEASSMLFKKNQNLASVIYVVIEK